MVGISILNDYYFVGRAFALNINTALRYKIGNKFDFLISGNYLTSTFPAKFRAVDITRIEIISINLGIAYTFKN